MSAIAAPVIAPVPEPSAPEGQSVRRKLVIEPSRGWVPIDFRALWEYRELLYFLAWRDVKVRYKQTALGIFWAVVQPLLAMAIFTLIFGRIANLPSDGVPYPLFSYTALLIWTYFSGATSMTGNSLVGNSGLITKVYFPRLVVPLAAVIPGLVDFGCSLVVLLAMMPVFGYFPTARLLVLPFFLAHAVLAAVGTGLWIAALTVRFRDMKHVLPVLMQLWLYATPVVYSVNMVPAAWRWSLGLNPMAGVVSGFRWAFLGSSLDAATLLTSIAVSLVLTSSGVYFFRQVERTFADVV